MYVLIRYTHDVGSIRQNLRMTAFSEKSEALLALIKELNTMIAAGEIHRNYAQQMLVDISDKNNAWFGECEYEIREI